MSTIHSTFNRVNTSYTVIGSRNQMEKTSECSPVSAIILGRGGRPYRLELYSELQKLGINEVVSIEQGAKKHYDLEQETMENENLRFLILQDKVSVGEMINIGMYECCSNCVLVIWDDMFLNSKNISYRVFDKISENDNLCTVPIIKQKNGDLIPTFMTPLFNKEMLKVLPLDSSKSDKSLYPYMYAGIYNKDKFIKLGGYDIDLRNSYWQKLDFGLRAYMWGEVIKTHNSLLVSLTTSNGEIDDITPDKDYRLYSLKNLSVVVKNDIGVLPSRRFFSYYEKSGSSFFEAIKEFRAVRKWVRINRYRFKYSAPEMTAIWDDL